MTPKNIGLEHRHRNAIDDAGPWVSTRVSLYHKLICKTLARGYIVININNFRREPSTASPRCQEDCAHGRSCVTAECPANAVASFQAENSVNQSFIPSSQHADSKILTTSIPVTREATSLPYRLGHPISLSLAGGDIISFLIGFRFRFSPCVNRNRRESHQKLQKYHRAFRHTHIGPVFGSFDEANDCPEIHRFAIRGSRRRIA